MARHAQPAGRGRRRRRLTARSSARSRVSRLLEHLLPARPGGRVTTVLVVVGVRRGLRADRHRADPPGRRRAGRRRGDGACSGWSTPRRRSSASETGVDWNVIFLLLGMMVIVSVVKQTGVFEYVAIWAAKRARGRPFAMMVMLVVITALASALLDNVTTVLLIAPVTLLVCDRLGAAAGAVPDRRGAGLQHRRHRDPDRRPAQHHHRQPGRAVLQRLPGQPRAAVIVLVAGRLPRLCRVHVPVGLRATTPKRVAALMALDERDVIRDRGLLIRSGVVLSPCWSASSPTRALHLEPSLVALLGAGALVARLAAGRRPSSSRRSSGRPWSSSWACSSWSAPWSRSASSAASDPAVADAVGDNYLLAVTGAAVRLRRTVRDRRQHPVRRDHDPDRQRTSSMPARRLGAAQRRCGGRWPSAPTSAATPPPSGASANVVIIGIAARNGHPISFWHFTKYGRRRRRRSPSPWRGSTSGCATSPSRDRRRSSPRTGHADRGHHERTP